MKIFLLLYSVLFMSGCAFLVKLTPKPSVKSVVEGGTEKYIERTARLGEVIYKYNKTETKIISVYKNSQPVLFPTPYENSWLGFTFDKDTVTRIEIDSLKTFRRLSTSEKDKDETWIYYRTLIDFPNIQVQPACYFVVKNSELVRMSYNYVGAGSAEYDFTPHIPVSPTVDTIKGKDILRYELLYSGMQDNSISLTYKEIAKEKASSDSLAVLQYKLAEIEDNVIGFNTIKIKILEYTNQYIKYKIID